MSEVDEKLEKIAWELGKKALNLSERSEKNRQVVHALYAVGNCIFNVLNENGEYICTGKENAKD